VSNVPSQNVCRPVVSCWLVSKRKKDDWGATRWLESSRNLPRHFGLPLDRGAARRKRSIKCHFQSAIFLTDSQLALALLLNSPEYLQPKSFWDIWTLSDSISSRVALSFQWVPIMLLHGNELADSLAKPEQYFPLPMYPLR